MGITHVEVEVANTAAPDAGGSLEFLVGSGAVYSVAPSAILERLGSVPSTAQAFRLAYGGRITRRKGGAVFRFGARAGVSDVVFGEPGDANLRGAWTLEALGPSLDPPKRELRELPMLL